MPLVIFIAFPSLAPIYYFPDFQVGCLLAKFKAQAAISSRRVTEADATLESEWAA